VFNGFWVQARIHLEALQLAEARETPDSEASREIYTPLFQRLGADVPQERVYDLYTQALGPHDWR